RSANSLVRPALVHHDGRGLDAVGSIRAAAEAHLIEAEGRSVGAGGEAASVANRAPIAAIERRHFAGQRIVSLIVGPLIDVAAHVVSAEGAHARRVRSDGIGLPKTR